MLKYKIKREFVCEPSTFGFGFVCDKRRKFVSAAIKIEFTILIRL